MVYDDYIPQCLVHYARWYGSLAESGMKFLEIRQGVLVFVTEPRIVPQAKIQLLYPVMLRLGFETKLIFLPLFTTSAVQGKVAQC